MKPLHPSHVDMSFGALLQIDQKRIGVLGKASAF